MNQKYFQTSGEGKVKGKQGKYNTTKNGDKSMKIYNTKYQSAFHAQKNTTQNTRVRSARKNIQQQQKQSAFHTWKNTTYYFLFFCSFFYNRHKTLTQHMQAKFHTTQKYKSKIQHAYNTLIKHAYNTRLIQHEKYNIKWSFWARI